MEKGTDHQSSDVCQKMNSPVFKWPYANAVCKQGCDKVGSNQGVAVTRMDSFPGRLLKLRGTELEKYFHRTPSPIQSGEITADNRHQNEAVHRSAVRHR